MPARKDRTGQALADWQARKALRQLRGEELKAVMRAQYDNALLSARECAAILGVTPKMISDLEDAGDFPPRVRIGINRHGYMQAEFWAWLEARKARKG
jgi:predicted DNA-binding transcriptional regulator AlpA